MVLWYYIVIVIIIIVLVLTTIIIIIIVIINKKGTTTITVKQAKQALITIYYTNFLPIFKLKVTTSNNNLHFKT